MNNKMNENFDALNLIDICKLLWVNKFSIISIMIISTLLGFLLSTFKQNTYHMKTSILPGEQQSFLKYQHLNQKVREILVSGKFNTSFNALGFTDSNDRRSTDSNDRRFNGLEVTNSNVFSMFVNEFNDYNEMATLVKESPFVKESITSLDPKSEKQSIIDFAKSFYIKSEENEVFLYLEWYDKEEALELIKNAVGMTLKNVQMQLYSNINLLVDNYSAFKKYRIAQLNQNLKTLKYKEDIQIKQRILFLNEQLEIAKDLNIENTATPSNVFLAKDNLYYLRGYKALTKELEHAKTRTKISREEILIIEEIKEIENEFLSLQLEELNKLNEDSTEDWIILDTSLAEFKLRNITRAILASSAFLGLILGIFYALLKNQSLSRKKNI